MLVANVIRRRVDNAVLAVVRGTIELDRFGEAERTLLRVVLEPWRLRTGTVLPRLLAPATAASAVRSCCPSPTMLSAALTWPFMRC